MKMDEISTAAGVDYRTENGARVHVLQKGLKGHLSSRRDHVKVRYVGGRRDGQEGKIATREILRRWNAADEENARKRAEKNKKIGAMRVRLAALGIEGTVTHGGWLQFQDEGAERVLDLLERASEVEA